MQPTGAGAYQVTLDVVAKKMRAASVGNETAVPMNALVEIGGRRGASDLEAAR